MGMSTNTRSHNASVTNLATGYVVTDGAAAAATVFTCGFVPRYIKWVNLTTGAMFEYFEGMAAATAATAVALGSVPAGTRAPTAAGAGIFVGLPTTTPVVINPGQFQVPAAAIPASSSFSWMAMG